MRFKPSLHAKRLWCIFELNVYINIIISHLAEREKNVIEIDGIKMLPFFIRWIRSQFIDQEEKPISHYPLILSLILCIERIIIFFFKKKRWSFDCSIDWLTFVSMQLLRLHRHGFVYFALGLLCTELPFCQFPLSSSNRYVIFPQMQN